MELLETTGACSYQELSERFGVTVMTIRRDADRLANEGLVIKTLGGIQKAGAPSYYYESSVHSRMHVNLKEKQAIASSALELLEPHKTVFLDGSTTSLHLARLITENKQGLTIVTNSAVTALELSRSSENMVVGIGGQIDRDTASFLGSSAEEQASRFFVDMAFMSTKGFVIDKGTYESSVGNLRIKQIIVSQCADAVLMVDHSKFGVTALCKAIDISDIGTIVTDELVKHSDLEFLQKLGKKIRIAGVEKTLSKKSSDEVINVA